MEAENKPGLQQVGCETCLAVKVKVAGSGLTGNLQPVTGRSTLSPKVSDKAGCMLMNSWNSGASFINISNLARVWMDSRPAGGFGILTFVLRSVSDSST